MKISPTHSVQNHTSPAKITLLTSRKKTGRRLRISFPTVWPFPLESLITGLKANREPLGAERDRVIKLVDDDRTHRCGGLLCPLTV